MTPQKASTVAALQLTASTCEDREYLYPMGESLVGCRWVRHNYTVSLQDESQLGRSGDGLMACSPLPPSGCVHKEDLNGGSVVPLYN